MSPGQTGRTPGGVPPKFFMFIGFFSFPISEGNSRKVPERRRKRSQSFSPREYGWDPPNPIIQCTWRLQSQNSLPLGTAGDASFSRSGFRRGPLRAGHGIPSSTGGISQKPGNHPNFEKNALGVKRPFSEQLSEFRGILGAILGMALTTCFM